jgi:dethiobiotin synthetase
MGKGFFVTGTDTNVGKTVLAALFVRCSAGHILEADPVRRP